MPHYNFSLFIEHHLRQPGQLETGHDLGPIMLLPSFIISNTLDILLYIQRPYYKKKENISFVSQNVEKIQLFPVVILPTILPATLICMKIDPSINVCTSST